LNNTRLFDSIVAQLERAVHFGQACLVVAASGNESRTDVNAAFKLGSQSTTRSLFVLLSFLAFAGVFVISL